MDLKYFDMIWQNEEKNKERKRGNVALWDSRADQFNRYGTDERRDKILKILLDKQMLHKDSTVLDIGCGPGKFAVEFAKVAKYVAGVDISPKMLQHADENLAASGSGRVDFMEMDWDKAVIEDLNWKKKFSLVTGIMSPVFWNRRGLEKMMEASNDYCFICHFVERRDLLGDTLMKKVIGDNHVDEFGNTGLYCSLNILWLYQLYPEVVYFDTKKEVIRSVEEAAENYINKYEFRKTMTATQKQEIRNLLNSMAIDGCVKDTTTAKVACICWKNK